MTESVTRYVGTYINKDGDRTLMVAAQGRNTYATAEEAQAWLDAVKSNNDARTIAQVWGANPRFEVRPCPCYPGHFDPQTCWFKDAFMIEVQVREDGQMVWKPVRPVGGKPYRFDTFDAAVQMKDKLYPIGQNRDMARVVKAPPEGS